jgi:uncharacterized protein YuzE
MTKPIVHYDHEQDILYIVLREGEEHHFDEVADGIIVEFDAVNQPIGIEIFNAMETIDAVIGRGRPVNESVRSAQAIAQLP